MKRNFTAILFLLTLVSCNKENKNVNTCFTVKQIGAVCNDIVYQIQDPAFYYLGENNWFDALSGNTYDHVFKMQNTCEMISLNVDKTAKVQVIEDQSVTNCFFCLAIYPGTTPVKKLAIKNCN